MQTCRPCCGFIDCFYFTGNVSVVCKHVGHVVGLLIVFILQVM